MLKSMHKPILRTLFLIIGAAYVCPSLSFADEADSVAIAQAADALTRRQQIKTKMKRTGSLIYRFIKNFDAIDTTYIAPNYYNYTAMLQNTNFFQTFHLLGTADNGTMQSISTKPDASVRIGPYFGWRWIFIGYTFDVTHPKTAGKFSELSFRIYSSMLGCDFIYIRNEGDYRLRRATGFKGVEPKSVRGKSFSGINSNTLSFSAYYVFKHKRFSYPATFNQSTQQRKSAGSGMLGIGYSSQNVSFDYTKLPAELIGTEGNEKIIDELKFSNINYRYFYLSGGYAYNWVFARNWVLGGSAMPTIGVRKAKGEKLRGTEVLMDIKNLSLDCTSRLGIVWNNSRWFAGASFISHLYLYRKDRLSITNSVNYGNIYFGVFFNRRKQYR